MANQTNTQVSVVSASAAQTTEQESTMNTVITAKAPSVVIKPEHIKVAQAQALAPEVESLLNRKKDSYPMTAGVLNALVVGRSALRSGSLQNQIRLPEGWTVGMNFVVPACFEANAEFKNGKWVSVPAGVIPALDMLRVFGNDSESEQVRRNFLKQSKEQRNALVAAAARALRNCGFTKEQTAAYKTGVAQIHFWVKNSKGLVVVPSEFKSVLNKVFRAAYPDMAGKSNRIFYINTNWAKPAHGLDYKKILGVFRVIEQKQQELGFGAALCDRPLTLVESVDSFEVYFGINFSMTFSKDGSVIAHNRALGNDYLVKSMLVSARRFYGEVSADDLVVLNPFDVVFYMMENFHLLDMNRDYVCDVAGRIKAAHTANISTCAKFHHSTEKFVLEAYPVQMIADWWNPSFAMERFASSASAVMVGMPGLLGAASRYAKDATNYPLGVKRVEDKTNMASELKIHARRAALVEGFGETVAKELDSRRAIAAALQHGFICQTYGNCSSFARAELYTLSPMSVEAAERKQWLLDVCANGWGKLAKKFGAFSEAAAVQFLASLVGIEPTGTAQFWETVAAELVVLNSTKQAKFTSRVDKMMFPVDMPIDGMERQRIRSVGNDEVRLVKPARFALCLGIPAEPGMSYVRPGFLSGYYVTTGKPQVFYHPCPANPIALSDKLAAVAVENITSTGLRSWKFEGVVVEEGEVIGTFTDEAGNQSPIYAERDGEMIELRFGTKKEMTGVMFYCVPRYKNVVTSHKARLNVKANLVAADIDAMLALNSDELAADVIIMSDAFKASDLTCRGIFDFIGETFCRSPKYRPLIAKANALAGVDDKDDIFFYDDRLRKAGKYQFLFDVFVADFGRDIWWTTPCTSDYAQQFVDIYSGVSGAGFKNWRRAYAEEVLDNNVCLPIDAVVFTNGGDEIDAGDNIIATYVDEEGINWMCQRGFGFAGTEEAPLYGPMLSEYSAIEQAVGDTAILGFDMVELGLAGKYDLAKLMLNGGDRERELHVALDSILSGKEFKGVETVDVDVDTVVFSDSDIAALADIEDRVEWMKAVVSLKAGTNFRFSFDEETKFSLFVPALAALGLGGLNSPQESIVSKLYTVLRMLFNGYNVFDANVMSEVKQLRNMVSKYVHGEGHIKALVRGGDSTAFKVASLPIIPVGTSVVLKGGRVDRKYRQLGMGDAVVVGKWRSPIRNCVFQSRIVLDENNLDLSTEFSRLYALGFYSIDGDREFDGRGQGENYGDYDGDGCKAFGLTAEQVAEHGISVTNYEEMMGFIKQVVGADMCSVEFWSQEEPIQQFYADHFWSAHKNELLSKLNFDASKALISRKNLAKFLKSACGVQKVAVGKVYRTSAVHAMLAEILAADDVRVALEAAGCDWLGAFDYVKDNASLSERLFGNDKLNMSEARLTSSVIETLYEQMLGGYSGEMVDSVLGNIARAVDAQDEVEWHTPQQVAGRLECVGDLGAVAPSLSGLMSYTKVSANDAKASLAALGYSPAYLETFERAAMLAGFANKLPSMSDEAYAEFVAAAPELALVLNMAQAVMDCSQGRAISDRVSVSLDRAAALARSNAKIGALSKVICRETVSGSIFKKLFVAHNATAVK